MAGPSTTRHFGSVTRIYKNQEDIVLAIDDISVDVEILRIQTEDTKKWHHSATFTHNRTLLYLGTADRVVDLILVVGDFDSISLDAGNFNTPVWDGSSVEINDVTVNFQLLPQIGATV